MRYDDPWWATLSGLAATGLLAWLVLAYKTEVQAALASLGITG